jgi:transposase
MSIHRAMRSAISRIRGLFRRKQSDAELSLELESHPQLLTETREGQETMAILARFLATPEKN